MCSNRKIICKGIVPDMRETRESVEERIVSEDKEKGGEGTALLHPSLDINPRGGVLTEERGHPNAPEGTSNKTGKPRREAYTTDDTKDPRVVDGVKGFSCVKEEEEPTDAVLDPFEEKGVNIKDVIATRS